MASRRPDSPSAATSMAWPSARRPRATAAASFASSSTTSSRISAPVERDQLEALRAALDRGLGELADPARVPLAVTYAGLQPRPLGGLENVVMERTQGDGEARPAGENAEAILGHARIALLQEQLPRARMRRHVHPGPCAVT